MGAPRVMNLADAHVLVTEALQRHSFFIVHRDEDHCVVDLFDLARPGLSVGDGPLESQPDQEIQRRSKEWTRLLAIALQGAFLCNEELARRGLT